MSTGQTISDVCVRERKREREFPFVQRIGREFVHASLHQILFWESEQYHNNES